MKSIKEKIIESSENNVYVIYLDDDTMYNYYMTEEDAKKEADSLNKESKCNNAKIKKEPISNFIRK